MYDVYVYDAFTTDFDNIGLVGALTPTSCEHDEVANGASEVVLAHPLDEAGKWKGLMRGNILKVWTRVRTTPEIDDGELVRTVEKWTVKQTSSKAERVVYSKKADGKKLGSLKKGANVLVVRKPADSERYKIKSGSLSGWIASAALEYEAQEVLPTDPTAIEDVYPQWALKEQLFRIYNEERTLAGITVYARHITYDLIGNMTLFKNAEAVSLNHAATRVLERCVTPHDFTVQTDIADTRTGVNWRHQNPIYAYMDPEEGITARWDCQLVRDNYEFTFLKTAGKNRGMAIEYGKNLTGITCNVTDDEVVTRVLPTGVAEDGGVLYLTDDLDGANYVDADNIASYPSPHIYRLECENCTVSDDLSVTKARQRMREQAEELLSGGAKMPVVSLKVEFLDLGSAEEYRQYKGLISIDLYDKVRVKVPRIGFDGLLDAVRVRTDCLSGQPISVEIGALQDVEISIQSYQIGAIHGGKIIDGTIGNPSLGDGIITADKIVARAITAEKIVAGAITAEKISAGAVTAEKISAGAITADKISAGAITAAKIQAGTITAQQLQAGLITADSGLIAVGAIQTAQIADASITSAKIVELNADLIKSGTLMTERLLLVGEGGVVYEINAASSGLSQTELAEDKYKNYLNGTVIVANSITAAQIAAGTITANEIAANAITAAKINVADLFASEATIAAINAMDIRSNTYLQLYVGDQIGDIDEFRAGTTVEITKDIFRVTAATTQFAVPGAEEDGQEIVAIDADGLRADTVAKAGKGGVFTVGEGGDFEYLADAFGSVNERYIAEDVTFRMLSASDPGGVLRGVTGPGRVHIMPANISAYADTAAWTTSGVTVNQLSNGVYLQASSAGTWKRATLRIGRVGALGIIGKRLRIKAKMGTYNSTVTGIVMQMIPTLGETALAYIAYTGSVTTGAFQTRSGSFVIPEWANYWDELSVVFELSEGTSVSSGAQAYYYELVLEIGEDEIIDSAVTAVTLNSLTIDGCTAEVCMHELVFPGRLTARQSATAVNRCTFTGNHGYHVYGGSGFMNACYGSCAYAAVAAMAGGAVQVYGTAPAGEKTGLVETANMSTDAPGGNTPVTPTTLTVQAKTTGTYDGANGWWSGAAIRQGYTADNGRMRGGIWFDLSALPSGAVISKLTLRLRRVEGYGKGGAVNVKIYGTTSPAKSGAPAVEGSAVTGTIGSGKTKTFDVTSLKAYSGFVLYADDTAAVSGKKYSANYARFTGTGGGADTIPTLIATYTTA